MGLRLGGIEVKTVYDRVIPSDYYSVYDIAKYENIPEEKMKSLYDTMTSIINAKCMNEGIKYSKAAEYWDDVGLREDGSGPRGWKFDKTINTLYWHTKLEPIADLFRIFLVKRMSYTLKGQVWMCDFGIRKTHYERWKKTGKRYNMRKSSKCTKYCDTSTRTKRTKLFIGNLDSSVDIPKSPQYLRFKAGIENASKMGRKQSMAETAMAAISEYMDARPEIFGTVDGYVPKKRRVVQSGSNIIHPRLSKETVERLYGFIERWNSGGNAPVNMSEVVERAIIAYLAAMPHKYSDPELYAAEQELAETKK